MVNEKFIRNVAPLNRFKLDIFVKYGNRFRFEFYDGDCINIDGQVGRMIYEVPFTDKIINCANNERKDFLEHNISTEEKKNTF